jgi:hypothetical protein
MAPSPVFDQGPYNAAGYVAANKATWPQFQPPARAYQPGMWWTATSSGTVDGEHANVGDYIFVTYRHRTYGEWTFGDGTFGDNPHGNWSIESVGFTVFDTSLPPRLWPPFPYAGCAFDDERFPGWRIVVDALYRYAPTRTYGQLTYGDGVYGDVGEAATPGWGDITRPVFLVDVNVGTDNGAPAVDVTTISIEMYDDEGAWIDVAEPAYYFLPFVGDPIRVGFLDPALEYHPICVGIIETIRDDHDTLPRYVSVGAFGNDMDLANDHLYWQRPAELVSARFAALMAAGGWRFGTGSLVYPGDAPLHADLEPLEITTRTEIDRTVMSAGWFFDTTAWGEPRLREWPHVPTGEPLEVVDCVEPPVATPHAGGPLQSHRITFGADMSQLLNVVSISNQNDPQLVVTAKEEFSISEYGRRSNAMGFPMSGLAFADSADAVELAVRYVNRWAFIVRQVSAFAADTDFEAGWLAELVDLDTGRAVTVTRNEIRPMVLDAVIVGYEHRITPKRIESTINLSTVTTTQ